MKKLLLLLVGLIALVSCNSPKTKEVDKIYPIEQWVMDYVKKHPNCMNNEITKKQTIDDFIKAVDDSTHKDWMEGIPVELETINKVNDKYVAQFGSYFTISQSKMPLPSSSSSMPKPTTSRLSALKGSRYWRS